MGATSVPVLRIEIYLTADCNLLAIDAESGLLQQICPVLAATSWLRSFARTGRPQRHGQVPRYVLIPSPSQVAGNSALIRDVAADADLVRNWSVRAATVRRSGGQR